MIAHVFTLILSCSGHECPNMEDKLTATYATKVECRKIGDSFLKLNMKTQKWSFSCVDTLVK